MSHIYFVLGRDSYCHRPYNRFLLYDVCCRRCDTIFRQDWSCFLVVCTIVKSCMVMLWLDRQCFLGTNWFNFNFPQFQISKSQFLQLQISFVSNFFNFKFQPQTSISNLALNSNSNFKFLQKNFFNSISLHPSISSNFNFNSTSISNCEGQ